MSDLGLAVTLLALHLTAIGAGGGLLAIAFRSDTTEQWSGGGSEGWGGEPSHPPDPPTRGGPIGPPLRHGEPTRTRMRGQRPRRGQHGLARPDVPHCPGSAPARPAPTRTLSARNTSSAA
jgi:hypothetical protein